MNAGEKTINWLFRDQLQVDEEWSVLSERGFTWWAYQNAQRIEIIDAEETVPGEPDFFVSIRTEVAEGVELTPQVLAMLNVRIMPLPAMAGVVYDERARILSLCSLVKIHERIRGWMLPIIGTAAALQVSEASTVWPELAGQLGGRFAVSGHPRNGLRSTPDEILGVGQTMASMEGDGCGWEEEEFDEAVARYMQRPPSLGASCGGHGLTVELPFGRASSLCEFKGDEVHPRWGSGLLILQRFPVAPMSDEDGARLALTLNAEELTRRPSGYGFGSFYYQPSKSPKSRGGTMNFTGFLPNVLHKPGLLPNLYFACTGRAAAMEQRLLGPSERGGARPGAGSPESALSRLTKFFGW